MRQPLGAEKGQYPSTLIGCNDQSELSDGWPVRWAPLLPQPRDELEQPHDRPTIEAQVI